MKKGFWARLATVAALSATIGVGTVSAASGNINIEGVNKVKPNQVFYQDVVISDITGDLITFGTGISVEDNSCIVFDHIENLDEDADSNLDRLAYVNINGLNGSKKVARLYFKSLNNNCSAKIYLDEPTMSFIDNTDIESFKDTTKLINVYEDVQENIKETVKEEVKETVKENNVTVSKVINTNKVVKNNQKVVDKVTKTESVTKTTNVTKKAVTKAKKNNKRSLKHNINKVFNYCKKLFK